MPVSAEQHPQTEPAKMLASHSPVVTLPNALAGTQSCSGRLHSSLATTAPQTHQLPSLLISVLGLCLSASSFSNVTFFLFFETLEDWVIHFLN